MIITMAIFHKIKSSASLIAAVAMALRVGGGMLTLPLALRVLSQQEMGLYYTFISIAGFAILIDFGFGATISRNASYAMGGASALAAHGLPQSSGTSLPNIGLLTQLTAAVKRWYRCLAMVLFVLLAVGGGLMIRRQLELEGMSDSLLWCWIFFAANTAYGFMTACWSDLLVGIGSVRTNAIYTIISQSCGLVLLLAGLMLQCGLWSYVVSAFVAAMIAWRLRKKAFYRDSGIAARSEKDVSVREVFTSLWPMAWRQGMLLVGAFLVQRGSTLICSNFLGLSETARFGLSMNLLNIIFQVSAIPLMMVLPKIASLRVAGDIVQIRKLFFTRAYAGMAMAFAAMTVLVVLSPWLLKWIGSKTELLHMPWLLVLCGILLLENHHVAYCNLVLSTNQNPFVLLSILSGIAVFVACWYGAKWYGVAGILVAQASIQLLWANWWPVRLGLRTLKTT